LARPVEFGCRHVP